MLPFPFFAQFLRSLERSVKHLSGFRMNAQEMKIRKNPVIAKRKGAIVCSFMTSQSKPDVKKFVGFGCYGVTS